MGRVDGLQASTPAIWPRHGWYSFVQLGEGQSVCACDWSHATGLWAAGALDAILRFCRRSSVLARGGAQQGSCDETSRGIRRRSPIRGVPGRTSSTFRASPAYPRASPGSSSFGSSGSAVVRRRDGVGKTVMGWPLDPAGRFAGVPAAPSPPCRGTAIARLQMGAGSARFAPKLRVLDLHAAGATTAERVPRPIRSPPMALRRDSVSSKRSHSTSDMDEAQAIQNARPALPRRRACSRRSTVSP